MTVISGLLAARRLASILDRDTGIDDTSGFLDDFFLTNCRKLQLWGEGAVPFFLLTALGLEQHGHHALSEQMMVQLIAAICIVNGKNARGVGLTNPYWTIEKSLRLNLGLEPYNREEFLGTSYTLESLVQMLARRGLKQTLKHLWPQLTTMDYATMVFHESYEWLIWKARTAVLDTRGPAQPERWQTLVEAAEGMDHANLPEVLRARPSFIACFLLVYPHRFHPALVRHLDQAITNAQD